MEQRKQGVSQNAYQYLQDADANGDGYVSSEEIAMYLEFKRREFEDQDAQRDAMRKMTWFALWGMLLYPGIIVIASWLDVDDAAAIIGNIAPTYFVAIAGLVAAFFGADAFKNKKDAAPSQPMMPVPPRPRPVASQPQAPQAPQPTEFEEEDSSSTEERVTPTRKRIS